MAWVTKKITGSPTAKYLIESNAGMLETGDNVALGATYQNFIQSIMSEAGFKIKVLQPATSIAVEGWWAGTPFVVTDSAVEKFEATGKNTNLSYYIQALPFPPFFSASVLGKNVYVTGSNKEWDSSYDWLTSYTENFAGSWGDPVPTNGKSAYLNGGIVSMSQTDYDYWFGANIAWNGYQYTGGVVGSKPFINYVGANADTNEFYCATYDPILGKLVALNYFAPFDSDPNYTGSEPTRFGLLEMGVYITDVTWSVFSIMSYEGYYAGNMKILNPAYGTAKDFVSKTDYPSNLLRNLSPIYVRREYEPNPFVMGKFGSLLIGYPSNPNCAVGDVIDGYLMIPSNYATFPTIALPCGAISEYIPPVIPKPLPKPPPTTQTNPNTNTTKVNPEGVDYTALFNQYKAMCADYATRMAAIYGNYTDVGGNGVGGGDGGSISVWQMFYQNALSNFATWASNPNRASTL